MFTHERHDRWYGLCLTRQTAQQFCFDQAGGFQDKIKVSSKERLEVQIKLTFESLRVLKTSCEILLSAKLICLPRLHHQYKTTLCERLFMMPWFCLGANYITLDDGHKMRASKAAETVFLDDLKESCTLRHHHIDVQSPSGSKAC